MNPELSPPSGVRNAGRPSESDGFVSRSTRRSEMFAELGDRDRERVEREGDRLAVEVPVRDELAGLDEDERVVRRRVHLDRDGRLGVGDQVAARAVHLRRTAQRVGVLHLVAPAVRLDDRRAVDEAKHVRRCVRSGREADGAPGSRAGTRPASPGAPRARARTRCRRRPQAASRARPPSAAIADMNCVPLMSERPSFARSSTGSSPTRRERVGSREPLALDATRSPRRRAGAPGARAARDRPTRRPSRGSGRTGATPRFRSSSSSSDRLHARA